MIDMQLILATSLLFVMPIVVYVGMILTAVIINDATTGLLRSMKQVWPF